MIQNSPEDAESRQVAVCLQRLARREHPRLPPAEQVWWRASIIRRLTASEAAVERAARPARWSQVIGLAVTVSVVLLVGSAGLLVSEQTVAEREWLGLALVMIPLLALVPTAGLVAMLLEQS